MTLRWLDQPGGVWMGLHSLVIIAGTAYCIVEGKDLSAGIVSAYGVALGAYATHRTIKAVKGIKDDVQAPESIRGVGGSLLPVVGPTGEKVNPPSLGDPAAKQFTGGD